MWVSKLHTNTALYWKDDCRQSLGRLALPASVGVLVDQKLPSVEQDDKPFVGRTTDASKVSRVRYLAFFFTSSTRSYASCQLPSRGWVDQPHRGRCQLASTISHGPDPSITSDKIFKLVMGASVECCGDRTQVLRMSRHDFGPSSSDVMAIASHWCLLVCELIRPGVALRVAILTPSRTIQKKVFA
ncbi:hypothetical protein PGT21_035203 [Puccinia graminis f. sp. tritici]|uniref:Uncharacterized protein n=1 Tax=Puccinia graminis f. sp. tritici TaxID=56615 RepID=A0A5B0P2Z7_PUCGR|nr:hypothetical protein PGTUg99_007596 [Puccinia graminis f. sp. tritici]KAA1095064.1 hypothetical protein PGT21_035203 [Puccinia graminis f. sp. tritici]KAA1121329.1 hypothetical protein PGTUg99_009508 [Puccinia graminis f. sp. tritici]